MRDHLDQVAERPIGKVCQFFELIPQTKLKGHLKNKKSTEGLHLQNGCYV